MSVNGTLKTQTPTHQASYAKDLKLKHTNYMDANISNHKKATGLYVQETTSH